MAEPESIERAGSQEPSPGRVASVEASNPDLRTSYSESELSNNLKKMKDLIGSLTEARSQEKSKKITYRVVAEPVDGAKKEMSGNDIFKICSVEILRTLKLESFTDLATKRRCFFFSLPASVAIDKTQRRFFKNVDVNGQKRGFFFFILPEKTFRIVFTGWGLQTKNTDSKAVEFLRNEAWTSHSSFPSQDAREKMERRSITCFFPTHSFGVPPQRLLTYFATDDMDKQGVHARWSSPCICSTCGNAGHSQQNCPFEPSSNEAAWMFDLTSQHAAYHNKQLEFCAKRQVRRILMTSKDSTPSQAPSTNQSTLAPPSVPTKQQPQSSSSSSTSSSATASSAQPRETPSVSQQSTSSTSAPTPIPTSDTSRMSYAEALTRQIHSKVSTPKVVPSVEPQLRRTSLADTAQEIIKKAAEDVLQKWISLESQSNKPNGRTSESSPLPPLSSPSSSSSSSSPTSPPPSNSGQGTSGESPKGVSQ